MKRKLWYHSLAQRDFVNAAAWSQARWGARLTRRYLDAIEAQIQRIVKNRWWDRTPNYPDPASAR